MSSRLPTAHDKVCIENLWWVKRRDLMQHSHETSLRGLLTQQGADDNIDYIEGEKNF
jgi:hypothetical protein